MKRKWLGVWAIASVLSHANAGMTQADAPKAIESAEKKPTSTLSEEPEAAGSEPMSSSQAESVADDEEKTARATAKQPRTEHVDEPFDEDRTGQSVGPDEGAGQVITLEEAHKRAVDSHPQFKNIDEAIYQADMGIYKAWTMLAPILTAKTDITLNQRKVSMQLPSFGPGIPPRELVIQDKWAKSAGFTANLTLFNPETIPLIKMAYDSYEKERFTAQIRRNELLFAVTSAYYQAYSMKEMIRVAEENVAMANEFLRQANILRDAGQGTRIDVNRATIQLMAAEKELENAKGSEKQALLALKQLIDEDGPIVLQGPEDVPPITESIHKLKTKALDKRVELQEAEIATRLARHSKDHTLTKFLPKFDLTYNWSWSSAAGFTGANVNWMLIFGAKWDIFLGGGRIVDYKINQSQMRMATNNITQLTMDIEKEVEKRHLDMTQREIQLSILDKQVDLAKENHDLVTKQFRAGLVTSLDVSNAATELASKKILRVYERLLFDLDVLTLKKTIGEYSSLSIVPAG